MPWIEDDREIGAAALLVGGIDGWVQALVEVGADRRGEMAAGGEAEHADLVRIDVPFGGMEANQAQRSLRVLQGRRCLGIDVALALRIPVMAGVRNTIFQQYAGDSSGDQPVADLGAFE